MQKHIFTAVLALFALSAHAAGPDDVRHFYAGIATGQSKSTLENPSGERFSSKNHPLPVKLYGGVDLSDHLALEAGFSGATDKFAFDRRLFGTVNEPQLASRSFYVAAKGTVMAGERVGVHAKLGLAYSRFALSDAGANDRSVSGTKPMLGIGASYKLTDQVAATLEFEHYGTVHEKEYKLRRQQLQAGLKFGF